MEELDPGFFDRLLSCPLNTKIGDVCWSWQRSKRFCHLQYIWNFISYPLMLSFLENWRCKLVKFGGRNLRWDSWVGTTHILSAVFFIVSSREKTVINRYRTNRTVNGRSTFKIISTLIVFLSLLKKNSFSLFFFKQFYHLSSKIKNNLDFNDQI